ncbi:MAG: ribonuclease P [Methanomicrobiales archaeon]|nr:ribonuclease P [Methanomicrobiales archaeon]
MLATDATVFPSPQGNTSVRRMVIEARERGFDSIVAIGQPCWEQDGFSVIGGTLVREPHVKAVLNASRANASGKGLLVVNGGNNAFNRAVIQVKGVHVIRHLHKTEKNSFDHIIARMSAENHVAIDIDLRPLVMLRGVWRQKAIQRYSDITGLCERFGFPLTLSSNARSVVELKSVREILDLASLVGIAEPDARKALATVKSLLSPVGPVQVVL